LCKKLRGCGIVNASFLARSTQVSTQQNSRLFWRIGAKVQRSWDLRSPDRTLCHGWNCLRRVRTYEGECDGLARSGVGRV